LQIQLASRHGLTAIIVAALNILLGWSAIIKCAAHVADVFPPIGGNTSIHRINADIPQNNKAKPPYAVSPLWADIHASGPDSGGTITVSNNGPKPIEVTVHVMQLEISEDGSDSTKEDNDSFSLFPKYQRLPPWEARTFRFEWNKGAIERSETFYIEIDQSPNNNANGSAQIENLYRFRTIVNVDPSFGERHLEVEGVKLSLGPDRRPRPVLTVSDSGNICAKLSDVTLVLQSGRWLKTLSPSDLKHMIGIGLVQPGHRRRFVLPVDVPAGTRELDVRVIEPRQ
jgi:fimbrial chaperone protein